MGFDNVIRGSYGDEKVTSSAKIGNLPLGTRMSLPDGRIFALAKAGTVALTPGTLLEMPDPGDAALLKDLAVASAAAIGDTDVTITAGSVAVTEDLFADGYLHVNDVTGQGYVYKVKGNSSAAASSSITVTLEPQDPIVVALVAGSSQCGLTENEFTRVQLVQADTTHLGIPMGIAPVDVTLSYYFWVQRRGVVAVLSGDTDMTVGLQFTKGAATAGEAALIGASSASVQVSDSWGHCIAPAVTADYALVYLTME